MIPPQLFWGTCILADLSNKSAIIFTMEALTLLIHITSGTISVILSFVAILLVARKRCKNLVIFSHLVAGTGLAAIISGLLVSIANEVTIFEACTRLGLYFGFLLFTETAIFLRLKAYQQLTSKAS